MTKPTTKPATKPTAKPTARFTRLAAADRRTALIDAALACMSEGGIAAFTVDRISARAQVSRGLITHHFGGMSGLLAATYAQLYAQVIPTVDTLPQPASGSTSRLDALLDILFDPQFFNRPALNMWLTMWGAIANTPELTTEHRRHYAQYVTMVAGLIAERPAVPEGLDPTLLARTFICLVDGLSLQHCIDPPSMPVETARQAGRDFLTRHIGPI
jgi:AcrR family transcriptional regulator